MNTRYMYAGAHARDVHIDGCSTGEHGIFPTACERCNKRRTYYVPQHRA